MSPSNLASKLILAGFASAALFVVPAMSAPISVFPKDPLNIVPSENTQAPPDDAQILLVRGGGGHRGGAARGGAAYRGGAARGGVAYRGGAVVRRGAVVTGGGGYYGGGYYGGGYCDPNYQYCGGGGYYGGGVYPGGAVAGVYRGGAVARGGAVVRGGAARGAHVAHRGGGGRRR